MRVLGFSLAGFLVGLLLTFIVALGQALVIVLLIPFTALDYSPTYWQAFALSLIITWVWGLASARFSAS